MRRAHLKIINQSGKALRWLAIAFYDHSVADRAKLSCLLPVNNVVELALATIGYPQPDRVRFGVLVLFDLAF